ncbi:MAG: class I SAM-dependent methyltransferase [Sporomusaceae bacterium]|nr:class I SAM-dependent methyltransferase [Sporomusaceae bacterium]
MSPDPRWRYDEQRHSGVDFSSLAEVEAYDAYMQKMRDSGAEVAKIKAALGLSPDHVILDIGCGTGETALGLAPHCARVHAVDVSREMIHCAAAKAEKRGLANITFRQAGFLTCDYPAASLDAVISQVALHHLPDFWKHIALRRIHRLLKPGGRFLLQDAVLPSDTPDFDSYFAGIVAAIAAAGGEKVARDTETTLREEHPTLDWIMRGLLEKAGFTIVTTETAPPFIVTYLCVK